MAQGLPLFPLAGKGNAAVKHGVLVYYGKKAYKNIGDYIQSVAAAQYAGHDAQRMDRENLDRYGGDPVKVVMNGWFMYNPKRFPPSDRVVPLFASFHLNPNIEGRFFTDEVVAYLKAREPIGCRSTDVVEMMSRHGIKAEFSSCLTLTLGETFHHEEADTPPVFVDPVFPRVRRRDGVLRLLARFLLRLPFMLVHAKDIARLLPRFNAFVEFRKVGLSPVSWMQGAVRVLYAAEFLRAYTPLFGKDVLFSAEYISHNVSRKECPDEDALFAKAEALLHRYEKAPFVVTSRLHCTLPCLAMGTPVWTVIGSSMKNGRFGGNEDFINPLSLGKNGFVASPESIASPDGKIHLDARPPVRTDHVPFAERLREKVRVFFTEANALSQEGVMS